MESNWRVRLYSLANGQWQAMGIGNMRIEDNFVRISDENNEEHILNYIIGTETYRRQGDSIITWTDINYGSFAVNFREPENAQVAWEALCVRQGRNPFQELGKLTELPVPTPSNLNMVIQTLEDPMLNRDEILNVLLNTYFVQDLRSEFLNAERAGITDLARYSTVFKLLVSMANENLMEILLDDLYYKDFFGALEYDPEIQPAKYRSVLGTESFNNILLITDGVILKKIHLAFRLNFLKETATFKVLDDQTTGYLRSYLTSIWGSIVDFFDREESLQGQLLRELREHSQAGFKFLYELVTIAKNVSMLSRQKLFEKMIPSFLEVLSDHWSLAGWEKEDQETLQDFVCDLVVCIMQDCPLRLKQFLQENLHTNEEPLLLKMCKRSLDYSNLETVSQCLEIFKNLKLEDKALNEFLCDYFLNAGASMLKVSDLSQEEVLWTTEMINVLTQSIGKNTFMIRTFLTVNDVIPKVVATAHNKEKPIKLAVVKFMKEILAKNDEYIFRLLINRNCLRVIFDLWIECGDQENLLFSVIYSFVKEIEKIPSLNDHVCSEHLPRLTEKLQKLCQHMQKQIEPREFPILTRMTTCDLTANESLFDDTDCPYKKPRRDFM